MNRLLTLIFCVIATTAVRGQEDVPVVDSLIVVESAADTILIESYAKHYDPRKALLYAAVLPGLGQVYNKKYWKLPLVYGGMAATGYAINFYNKLYSEYRGYVFLGLEAGLGETEFPPPDLQARGMQASVQQYRRAVDKARRERDYMIIIMGVVYILQIVDAHVDAHLKEFDLNPRLQVRFEPRLEQDAMLGRQTGAALVFRF